MGGMGDGGWSGEEHWGWWERGEMQVGREGGIKGEREIRDESRKSEGRKEGRSMGGMR